VTEYLYEPNADSVTARHLRGNETSGEAKSALKSVNHLEVMKPLERRVLSVPDISYTHEDPDEFSIAPAEDDGDSNIHGYLEQQRVFLENEVGLDRLLKVYNLIANFEELEIEQVDYSDLRDILGVENQHLIDDIIQLVVADNFFG
jgi:hypothetical protein